MRNAIIIRTSNSVSCIVLYKIQQQKFKNILVCSFSFSKNIGKMNTAHTAQCQECNNKKDLPGKSMKVFSTSLPHRVQSSLIGLNRTTSM